MDTENNFYEQEQEEDLPVEERFGYWEKAGKMVVIEALLKMWRKQEHRVLIFTQGRQVRSVLIFLKYALRDVLYYLLCTNLKLF